MKPKSVDSVRISERLTIRPGMRVRLRGGGVLGERGFVRVIRILFETYRGNPRYWIDGINAEHQHVTVYVLGKPYVRFGQRWQAHRVSVPRVAGAKKPRKKRKALVEVSAT